MQFTILNWNVAGARFLETKKRESRKEKRDNINAALRGLVQNPRLAYEPDIITLQEVVQYKEPDTDDPNATPDKTAIENLIEPPPGYYYHPFPLIDSDVSSAKAKWNKVKKGSDWHPNTYFAQGNAVLLKQAAPHFPVRDLSNLAQTSAANKERHFIEQVRLDSGLYFGDRNTEPRSALVTHLVYDPGAELDKPLEKRKPLDVFVVDLHLTTLVMEREGVPEIDCAATRIRQWQLDIIFNGIISRYNSWRRQKYPDRGELRTPESSEIFHRYSPVWILAGDFNFTEQSEEYERVIRMNFIDTVLPDRKRTPWGKGTKARGAGKDPTLTLDYIFAGPQFISLDPLIAKAGLGNNRVIHDHFVDEPPMHVLRVSDHYPIVATIPLILPE